MNILVEERDQSLQSFKRVLWQRIARDEVEDDYWSDSSYDAQVETEDGDESPVVPGEMTPCDSKAPPSNTIKSCEGRKTGPHVCTNAGADNSQTVAACNTKKQAPNKGPCLGAHGQRRVNVSTQPGGEDVAVPTAAKSQIQNDVTVGESPPPNETMHSKPNGEGSNTEPKLSNVNNVRAGEALTPDQGTPRRRGH